MMYDKLTDEKINFQPCIFSKQNGHNFNLIFDLEGATGKGEVRPAFYYSSDSPS